MSNKAIEQYFSFYLTDVKPLVASVGTQQLAGMHGLNTHTNAVVFRGIDFAMSLKQNPVPVIFACAFHDMARIDDGMDTEHGKRAVPMAMGIMKHFPGLMPLETQSAILYAIANHTTGEKAPDYISACLWDADRVRLSWKYGFNPKFFNTTRGAHIASHNFQEYIDFQKSCLPYLMWSKQY